MKNSVLILDNEAIFYDELVEKLTDNGLAVFATTDIEVATDLIFSEGSPAIFVTDLKYNQKLTKYTYEALIRDRYDFEAKCFGNTGALALIADVQKKVRDTRIILISAIDPKISAEKSGVFAYATKPIWDFENDISLVRFIEACRLGPLRPEEMDISGKLKAGALDLRSSLFQSYLERFRQTFGLERE